MLWFCIVALNDWLALLSQPIRSKTKTNCDMLVLIFSHAWCQQHVFALSLFHWIVCIVVIEQSNFLGFGFYVTKLKTTPLSQM